MQAKVFFIIITFSMISLASCSKKETTTIVPPTDTTQTYFSIKQYIQDQAATYGEQPFSLNRFATVDGKTDSSMVNFVNMEWGPVLKAFIETDISAVKFLGHYRFSRFEEERTGNFTLSYDAIDADLFTRTLQLTVDPTNNRILNIYIQTSTKEKSQKLLYIPLKIIQIQEAEASWTGTKHNLRLEYRFLQ